MARKHLPFRPRIDALEGRVVLSTLTVVSNTQDSGPGSLRAGIAAAHSGDTIAFSPTLKGLTIALTGGELLINKSLNIQGPIDGQLTISGGNTSRVFEVAAGVQATLTDLTLSDGDGHAAVVAYTAHDGDGGAILNWGTLTVSGSTVSDSSAQATGGGIYNAGTLTVSNKSTISDNTAYRGGGIYNAYNHNLGTPASASISGSTLSGNTGTGGVVSGTGWGSFLAWNEGGGGAIWNDGTMTVTGGTLSGNVSRGPLGGGGVYNSGSLTLTSCPVSGNSAVGRGGGIYNDVNATLTLKQSDVTKNTSPFQGADLYNLGHVTNKGSKIG